MVDQFKFGGPEMRLNLKKFIYMEKVCDFNHYLKLTELNLLFLIKLVQVFTIYIKRKCNMNVGM